MKARFLHIADCHLGYRQYNLRERFNDFGRAFFGVIDVAIQEKVDFVLLAGDLFHKRAIDALTLNQAIVALDRLKQAGIPCIAVEGNHEHAYIDDFIGWMKFLALREYLVLLDADFKEGAPQLKPYARRAGSYIDPVPGLRVHGLRYMGAGTRTAVANYAKSLASLPKDGVEFSIFMTHAGIEGEVAEQMGGLSMGDWSPLREHCDYVALGHIHKPFVREDWIHNPGSLETCSAMEAIWPDRGYLLVEVDTSRGDKVKHTIKQCACKRRQFVRLSFKTDLIEEPEALYSQLLEMLTRRARDLGIARLEKDECPVVDLQLHGVLQFDRSGLSIPRIEEMIEQTFKPLHIMVRNQTRSNDLAIETGETVNRRQLERRVLADLFARDARYRSHSAKWAQVAISLKNLAADGATPDAILDELTGQMARIGLEPAPESTESTETSNAMELIAAGMESERADDADPVG